VLVLETGRIVEDGPPSGLLATPGRRFLLTFKGAVRSGPSWLAGGMAEGSGVRRRGRWGTGSTPLLRRAPASTGQSLHPQHELCLRVVLGKGLGGIRG
jgi:hypothetical protein